jgi:hypothetical protein
MKKVLIIMLLSNILMTSCKKESQIEVFGIKTKKEFNQLKKAKWFLGKWENSSKDVTFKEIWKIKNDSSFFAESFVIVKNDTVFYEEVNLEEHNDSLFYIVSVKNQNNEKPVSFYLTSNKSNELVFENSKHDFPSKIIYKKINNDSIFAQISGTVNGKIQIEDFPMKRTK